MRDVDEVSRVHIFQRKRAEEGRFRGDLASEKGYLVHILPEGRNAQDTPTDARTREKTPSCESASRRRETIPPGEDGGGGGNRTHVRWTVLASHYERSLRFIFARRKPTGGPLARLVRSCSPLPPTNLRVPGKLALVTPKPTALARSGGRRYLRSECQLL